MQNLQQSILKRTKRVAEKARHVHINKIELQKLANEILSTPEEINQSWTDLDYKYHFVGHNEETVQWLFISSALNFSFWDGKAEELWEVEYNGKWLKGYWALTSALKKAVQTHDILNAKFLENMNLETLSEIFKGKGEPPLLKERVRVCQNIGKILNEKFNGHFMNAINQADNSAVNLVNIVAENFEDFRDVSTYNGIETPILKRAQILTADIWGALKGKSYGNFHDLDSITIFADYKLPQFLRALNVLNYSDQLAHQIDTYEIIEAGSGMEIELRALTIQAIEELKKATSYKFSAIQLDWWIWNNSFKPEFEKKPHHLTRSVYY